LIFQVEFEIPPRLEKVRGDLHAEDVGQMRRTATRHKPAAEFLAWKQCLVDQRHAQAKRAGLHGGGCSGGSGAEDDKVEFGHLGKGR